LKSVDLAILDTVAQIGVAQRRIDILIYVTGLSFDQAWSGRSEQSTERS